MTSVQASHQLTPAPHVKVERKVTSPTTRATNVISPASPTQRSPLATNKRYSSVQSKVGSLEAINYKPKPSEKKVQSFKQDFSHVRSKVDAKLVLPQPLAAAVTANDVAAVSPSTSAAAATPTSAARTTATLVKKPTVFASGPGAGSSQQKPLSPSLRTSSVSSIRTAGPQSSSTSVVSGSTTVASAAKSSTQSRRSSTSSATSPPITPTSPTRRLSKHIIPTQKVQYDHVKSKVGSFDNISYTGRGRASSHTSSTDEGHAGRALSPSNGRSRSPSARSSTSSTGNAAPTSPSRRSSFKIPPSKKVDYSKVKSKVNSLEFADHVPLGGNLRVFSEKLSFREQAQSKIAKEINIVQFYDYSFDNSIPEEQEGKDQQEQHGSHDEQLDRSIIYSSEPDEDDFEPPKNILSVLDEVTETVSGLELDEQLHQQQQQANEAHDAHLESAAAL